MDLHYCSEHLLVVSVPDKNRLCWKHITPSILKALFAPPQVGLLRVTTCAWDSTTIVHIYFNIIKKRRHFRVSLIVGSVCGPCTTGSRGKCFPDLSRRGGLWQEEALCCPLPPWCHVGHSVRPPHCHPEQVSLAANSTLPQLYYWNNPSVTSANLLNANISDVYV